MAGISSAFQSDFAGGGSSLVTANAGISLTRPVSTFENSISDQVARDQRLVTRGVDQMSLGYFGSELTEQFKQDKEIRLQCRALFSLRLQNQKALYKKIDQIVQAVILGCEKLDKIVLNLTLEVGELRSQHGDQAVIDRLDANIRSQVDLSKAVKGSLQDTFVIGYNALEKEQAAKDKDFQSNMEVLLEGRLKDIEKFGKIVALIHTEQDKNFERLAQAQKLALEAESRHFELALQDRQAAAQERQEDREAELKKWMAEKTHELNERSADLAELKEKFKHEETLEASEHAHTEVLDRQALAKLKAELSARLEDKRVGLDHELASKKVDSELELGKYQIDAEGRKALISALKPGCSIM